MALTTKLIQRSAQLHVLDNAPFYFSTAPWLPDHDHHELFRLRHRFLRLQQLGIRSNDFQQLLIEKLRTSGCEVDSFGDNFNFLKFLRDCTQLLKPSACRKESV